MDLDAQLLDRYARTRDADAFTQLVRRHAGMVFGVARRVTQDHHDAEEVAQSCFMELARQPTSIHGSLPGWLHAVATNRAVNFIHANHRRRHHEQAAARPEVTAPPEWNDIAPLVDAALAELSEEIRLPMVLYHFQGRNQAQVAADLGVSQPTISHRLEAGVAALRQKLKAAGVMVPSAALPALLSQHAVEAVPKTLMTTLGKLAVSGFMPPASGGGAASGGTATVSGASSMAAKGTAMLAVKVLAAFVITAAVTTAGITLLPKQQSVVAISVAQVDGVAANDSGELKSIIARLKAEIVQGLGDGVTIETWTPEIGPNSPQPRVSQSSTLKLYARQGGSQLFIRYDSTPKDNWGNSEATLPYGWPTPSVEQSLRFIDQHQNPYILQVTDGHTWWRTLSNKYQTPTILSSRVDGNDHAYPRIFTFVGYFWPDPSDLTTALSGHRQSNIELLRRPESPAIVGLHFTWKHEEDILWLDPTRNDVPVEYDMQVDKNAKAANYKGLRQYLEYAQLPNGLWYPSHWHVINANGSFNVRATFFPGQTLDAKWFGNPAARFAGGISNAAVIALPKPVAAIAAAYHSAWWWWPWALAAAVFATATALLIKQRRNPSSAPPLRGAYGPRRK